jgi:hypothetical protein
MAAAFSVANNLRDAAHRTGTAYEKHVGHPRMLLAKLMCCKLIIEQW